MDGMMIMGVDRIACYWVLGISSVLFLLTLRKIRETDRGEDGGEEA